MAAGDSPVGKAIQLLSDLQAKILKEGEDAQKVYREFAEWCEDRSRALSNQIKTGKAGVSELEAAIAQEAAMVDSLEAKVEQLAGELATDEADLKAATEIRAHEEAAFQATQKELVDVVDTLRRAVQILEREMKKGGAAMIQIKNAGNLAQALSAMVDAAMLSTADAGRLTALVQSSSEDSDDAEDVDAPAAAVYETHSGDIVQTLSDLLDKAEDQLDAARKKEVQDTHAFEMMQQSLKDEIKYGQKELAEAKAGIAAAGEKKASAQGDLQVTSDDLAGDVKGLAELHQECMSKAQDFESETKSRGEELAALAKAKEALKDNVGGAADLSYGGGEVSLLQFGTSSAASAGARTWLADLEAMRIVRDLGRKHHSSALSQLAARMRSVIKSSTLSHDDQFAKVKGLIQAMIERLESEANADATETAYCNKELAESNEKQADKAAEIEKLSTQIDKMSSRSAILKEQVAALHKALADLSKSQAEMDKVRGEEKEAFAASKADMMQGLEGVKLALKVLTEYYGREDKAHAAAEGAGSTVIGLLEVVESDFTKGLAEMTAEEETAEAEYEHQSKENEIERTSKEQDVKYKTKESTKLDKLVAETASDRSGVQAELDAVLEYLHNLQARCIAKAETYAERKARFEAEIAGLREALRVLESETALIQRGASGSRLRGVRRHVATA
eukprot:CAMPEP_0170260320 /NCGR_PEP_ID=MMETSP0116_2-20130129/30034_1 /TAXON_ID=400756 /ORGANISM="Durinskia baltica, Strain CSIRO CS-38" /LENGTH=677 /DNA_ID=CAMNT_0010511371 /DNA_START=121 /DNA_END=2154 /DNA_ORIENTATION=-